MKKKVLIAVHDPGGTTFLVPVIRRLQDEGHLLQVHAGPYARARLAAEGVKFQDAASSLTATEAEQIFGGFQPEVMLTATSWNSNLEQTLRNEAARRKIPSVVGIDFWSNYPARWQGAAYPTAQLADRAAVIDEEMRREMLACGFPAEKIWVCGHPFLERLGQAAGKDARTGKVKKILFLSEPMHGGAPGASVAAFGEFCRAAARTLGTAEVMFKPHPKEMISVAELAAIAGLAQGTLKVSSWSGTGTFPEDYARFDMIVGYQTMGLFEARAMGLAALSLVKIQASNALEKALSRFAIPRVPLNEQEISDALRGFGRHDFSPVREYHGALEALYREVVHG